jgi:hypothetical protein
VVENIRDDYKSALKDMDNMSGLSTCERKRMKRMNGLMHEIWWKSTVQLNMVKCTIGMTALRVS